MTKVHKFEGEYVAQGDLNIFKAPELPEGLELAKPEKNGVHIIAHSETGHHHVISADDAMYYAIDEFCGYLKVIKDTVVKHLRSFDTHDSVKLNQGETYFITRQREAHLDGWRRAAD
jgi:hypothetical protein